MGIFMDTLEDNIERNGQFLQSFFDTQFTLIQSSREVVKKMHVASKNEKIRLQSHLRAQLTSLCHLRDQSTQWEKILLELKRSTELYSENVKKRLDRMIEENHNIHNEVCNLIYEIRLHLSTPEKMQRFSLDESEERQKILIFFMDSIEYLLEHDTSLSVHDVKNIIKDCSSIIAFCKCDDEIPCTSPKQRFRKYLLTHYDLPNESYLCSVCQSRLPQKINYCLHCYTRK